MNENEKPGGLSQDPDRTEQLPVSPPPPTTFDEPVREPVTGSQPAGSVPDPAPAAGAETAARVPHHRETLALPAGTGAPAGTTSTSSAGPVPPTGPVLSPAPTGPVPQAGPVLAPRPSGPRVGTVVWGLVVVVIGLGLLATAAGFRIDLDVAAIVVLGAAGLALVGGSILTSLRRRR